jgi:FkbM family methyltransferase
MQFMKMARRAISAGAKKRGYQLIPDWKIDEVPLANHLRKLFAQCDIQIVLDVGANRGQYHDFLREDVGFQGQIISFEPVSKYINLLRSRLSTDAQWSVHGFALGSESGEAEINVTQSPGLNSFLAARSDIVQNYWNENSIIGVEKVQIRTLDDVLTEAGIDCATTGVYLKLDTQGFDLQVIKGASRSLKSIRALQTEASIRPIYKEMPTYTETISTMNENSFDLSGMFPVSHDKNLRLIELDFLFLNNEFCETAGKHADSPMA